MRNNSPRETTDIGLFEVLGMVAALSIAGCTDIGWPGLAPPPMPLSEDDPHFDPVTNPFLDRPPGGSVD